MGAILNGVEGMGGERSKRLEKEEGRKKEKRRMDEADKLGRSVGVGESKVNSEQRASVGGLDPGDTIQKSGLAADRNVATAKITTQIQSQTDALSGSLR